jgi:hypothetical protein
MIPAAPDSPGLAQIESEEKELALKSSVNCITGANGVCGDLLVTSVHRLERVPDGLELEELSKWLSEESASGLVVPIAHGTQASVVPGCLSRFDGGLSDRVARICQVLPCCLESGK